MRGLFNHWHRTSHLQPVTWHVGAHYGATMNSLRRYVVTGTIGALILATLYVATRPLMDQSETPLVHATVEPTPETTKPAPVTTHEPVTAPPEPTVEPLPTSGAYETGVRAAEELDRLWTETKDFSKGLWVTLTNEEK
jgi:hypothetical protein